MKKILFLFLLAGGVFIFSSCSHQPYQCTDPAGCVTVGNRESIKIGVLLTMSGQQSAKAAGTDALRGIQLAISDKGQVFGHSIELVQQDDQCSQSGGQAGAQALAADKQIAGVIGANCSSSSQAAAKILSDAGYVMISPSSTLPSLTDPHARPVGFLRTAYNDVNQAAAVAEFAFKVLGFKNMATVSDSSDSANQLAVAACQKFTNLGGICSLQVQLVSGQDPSAVLQSIAAAKPDIIFLPVNPVVASTVINGLRQSGNSGTAWIGYDGLMNRDFIGQTQPNSEGMYFSAPAPVNDPPDFLQKYKNKFGENPINSDHLQAYDAAIMLFAAIERVAVPVSSTDNSIAIPRQALRTTLHSLQSMNGLSGHIACQPTGDCAPTDTAIYQYANGSFRQIYP